MNQQIEKMILPDGTECFFLDLVSADTALNQKYLAEFVKEFELKNNSKTSEQQKEIKILISPKNVSKLNLDNLKKWETNFFHYSKNNLQKLIAKNPILDWQTYSQKENLEYKLIDDSSSEKEKELALEFMKDSFGFNFSKKPLEKRPAKLTKILQNFPKSLKLDKVKTYKIFFGEAVVGYFAIFESQNLIQLHSVAGFSLSQKRLNLKNRLPIIVSAALDTFLKIETSESKKFFFTCSKPVVLQKYLECGFEVSEGVVGVKGCL